MNGSYEKDLDLNLLRVFVVVAEAGSVTEAARRLYLTQPAVSAALRRLASALGAPLFVRAGRGLALTARGRRLLASARPHLEALVEAALSPAAFDARTSERTVRLGLSDASEAWLLAPLLRLLEGEAPRLRLVVLPVQFRTVADALGSSAVDLAVTVAGDLPAGTRRRALFTGGFVCLFDPRRARIGRRLTMARYLAHEHVVVSYNGDLRGVVEDTLGVQRRVRVSVSTFHSVGAVVEGSALLATVPGIIAQEITSLRPSLRAAALPLALEGMPVELLWRSAVEDDEAVAFLRGLVVRVASAVKRSGAAAPPRTPTRRRSAPPPAA
ncbi:LysR family transcriptional regulator [Sorangium sp. So ce131]|uniref:LysR family transcriptional regulator n=1 Tax=Sorangium sp. So ce131 TaxID=3133282 RepID=UPI003F6350B1